MVKVVSQPADRLHLVLLELLRSAGQLDWSRAVIDSSHARAARRGPKAVPARSTAHGGAASTTQLAGTGATVVLGSRDTAKAEAAIASIGSRIPGAKVKHLPLDLADLASLKAFVEALGLDRLDAVVHNAGVALDHPPRRETTDGHELMFATNHLGHFALTHQLAPLLMATPGSRVVTTGSFAAKSERLDVDDLQSTTTSSPSAPMSAPSWPRCSSPLNSTAACVPSAAQR
ncbi:hypothetical protein F4556_006776 [Kitasatospora gansuensis]|uniref:Uncharacterized protein n=1 Tax=Kitasatospora gansuensis TaxID=258050 RepID=A0A7W7WLA2_9ACTN|nr:hypothetical protein [Kitasatospora gansuensis]